MENNTITKAREQMYLFLSDLYLFEVDEEKLQGLKRLEFPSDVDNEEMKEGYAKIASYLGNKEVNRETIDELAVDYARVFLSAGVASGKAAFPYASVYTSKQHLMMQESAGGAVSYYSAKGLSPRKDMYNVPEDHLGLLLEFMGHLCKEDEEEQKEFLEKQLLSWVGAFAQDVCKYASTEFYKGLAKLTQGFVSVENGYLSK